MINDYSHPAFLNNLTPALRRAVLRFVNTGATCELLLEALNSEKLRNNIDLMMDMELKKYGK